MIQNARPCINSRCGAKLKDAEHGHCDECKMNITIAIQESHRIWQQYVSEDTNVNA